MPVPAIIAAAAGEFHSNTGFLEKAVAGIQPEQWLSRPNDHANHITWIVGHAIWARQALISRLGNEWSHSGLQVFVRGAKLDPSAVYPVSDALLAAWRECSGVLGSTLENITAEALAAPSPGGPPSPDGKLSGLVGVLVWHDTYHLGQLAYLRGWLGYPGVFG
jgi:hypothetical protein